MKRHVLILVSTLLSNFCFSQTGVDDFLKSTFRIFHEKDTAAFIHTNISSGELQEILQYFLPGKNLDTVTSVSNLNANDTVYTNLLVQKKFIPIYKTADSLQIALAKAEYIDDKYEVVKDTGAYLISLTGSIFFKCSNKYYQFVISEAVFLKDRWKIVGTVNLSQVPGTTLSTKKWQKISPLGTLKITLKDIKIESINGESHEPPPPPPPVPPKRKH